MSELQTPIWEFFGGLHLPDHKAESTRQPIAIAPVPHHLVLPLQQHIGEMAEPVVQVGDAVLKGQIIARAQGKVSAPVHASSSGRVTEIAVHRIPHPSGLEAPCIVIETDGEDRWAELPPAWPDYAERGANELIERIRWAGIVGLGGATFPTGAKLATGEEKHIHTLILNGAECEPYISCDDMLMRERADRVIAGMQILLHILGARKCLIGIENNKPEAIAAMRRALSDAGVENAQVMVVPTKYPSGGEKQLIKLLTGHEVPHGGLPADLGLLCQNVATSAAVADAVLQGRPLISRIVTLTGQGIRKPQNVVAHFGTLATKLIAFAGGYTEHLHRLILGGPMMGFTLHNDHVPITKACNCLLAASAEESPDPPKASPCIRCGRCADVCPARLLPQQLYWYAHARDFDKVQDYHLFDCIECGCCSHVCPSHIPLVQYYRFAKTEIWNQERERKKSDLARQRHEARLARLERIERERKERLRKKKEALENKSKAGGPDPKKAAIEAAMKRVAAKKALQQAGDDTPPTTASVSKED